MKQRVLIVNKFYYRRGGDCVCAINLANLLREQGHEVAEFAMRYPENLPSRWSSFWPKEVSFSGGASGKIAAVRRVFGGEGVKRDFTRMLDEFRPHIVHLHNIHSYISPIVARLARKRGIPVVWTMHDYKLVCPSYSCLRDGQPCELCFTDINNVVTKRCMKGSLAASLIAWGEAKRWSRKLMQKWTDRFICPSHFMARKLAEGGFAENKLVTICNFIGPEAASLFSRLAASGHSASREPYYCYLGRLSKEKGVDTLLAAASTLPFELRVAGDGPQAGELRERYAHCSNIRFLGHLEAAKAAELISRARLSVTPSECYENNPLSVIESLCAGTPVVGADIGGIPELIDPATGLIFPAGDVAALRTAIDTAWHTDYDYKSIADASLRRFSAVNYYSLITQLYDEVTRR